MSALNPMTPDQTNFLAALQIAYADLFANDPAYEYSASKCTAVEMAEKMIVAAISGRANVSGDGFKRACAAVGIAHTQKAIDAFLGVEKPVATPKTSRPSKVETIGLSNITVSLTGVARIDRAHDLVTLTYTDHTREAGKVSSARWQEIRENPFAIVSEIQSQRVPAV